MMFFQLHQPKGKVAFYAVILGLFFGFATAVSFQRSSRSCSAAASRIYIYLRPFCHLLSITRTDISVASFFYLPHLFVCSGLYLLRLIVALKLCCLLSLVVVWPEFWSVSCETGSCSAERPTSRSPCSSWR